MPAKNSVKQFVENGYYHIYNRGVEKRTIFLDEQDYKTFLSYLKFYLTNPNSIDLRGLSSQVRPTSPSKILRNYSESITLIAYCLMPNHFHLFIKQNDDFSMSNFMSSLSTKYVRYFNTRYKRVGHLFQDRYKAVRIEAENQWIHLSKYIHRNPLGLSSYYKESPHKLSEYRYSSYPNYLGHFHQKWVRPEEIIVNFGGKQNSSYQRFVEEPEDITPIYLTAIDYEC